MVPEKKEVVVEELFLKHAPSKTSANSAVNALKKALGKNELTAEMILHLDFCALCSMKGVGRKTVLLTAEVACDLAKLK